MQEDTGWRIGAAITVVLILAIVSGLATDPSIHASSNTSRSPIGALNSSSITSNATKSPTNELNSTQQVLLQVTQFLDYLRKGNVSALKQYYTSKSVVVLTGCTDGLGGRYNGSSQIEGLYADYENWIVSVSLNSSAVHLNATGPSEVNATYSLSVAASGLFGTINAAVSVQQQWTLSGSDAQLANGGWVVARETWNFLSLAVQSPLIQVPSCAS